MKLWGITQSDRHSDKSVADALERLLRFRNLLIIPMGKDEDGVDLVQMHCGRGDIASHMVKNGFASAGLGYAREERAFRRRTKAQM